MEIAALVISFVLAVATGLAAFYALGLVAVSGNSTRVEAALGALRAANDRNQLAERPFPDEVFLTDHTQCGEHGAFGPIDRTHHLRLDLRILVGEIN